MGAAHYGHEQMFELLVREVLYEWNSEANLLRHSLEGNIEKIKYMLASRVNINSHIVPVCALDGHRSNVQLTEATKMW